VIKLEPAKILRLLDDEGPISKKLKTFEAREEQKQLLAHLIDAFNDKAIALIEAGTGTGKSMAYLIPALLSAALWQEKVVISTQTISLQEQLLNKDLPLLTDALGVEIKASLVKGMGNYVCFRKWDEIGIERMLLPPEDREKLAHMEHLSCQKGVGSRSDFPFHPPAALWELIGADFESCNGQECPHYQNCYYFQARKSCQDAQILIVNHHLLLADIISRDSGSSLLPPYSRLIIDEAHNLEEIATDYFSTKISRLDLLKLLSRISSEKQGQASGKLPLIKEKMQKGAKGEFSYVQSRFLNQLTIELPTLKRELVKEITDTFHLLEQFQSAQNDDGKLRLKSHHYDYPAWKEEIAPSILKTSATLKRYAQELTHMEGRLKDLEDERLLENCKGLLHDLKALAKRLEEEASAFELFSAPPERSDSIRWLETAHTKGGINLSCIHAELDISKILLKHLFSPFDTVALLSATLTTQKSFQFLRDRMGLHEKNLEGRKVIEAAFESPFDFEKQALLIVPQDIPLPTSSGFLDAAEKIIWDAISASRGNAFILFTSYSMLKTCFSKMESKLKEHRYFPLKQGDESRGALLKRFIQQDRSILFGTDSFWEGVDVAGEALRLVIIAKLPFKVPTEPMIQARSEAIALKGGDPFTELLLPHAAIKFKQGFGRLIRNKKDRGCILCLDNRIISKPYGKYFLKTLPVCPLEVVPSDQLKQKMIDFYKRTFAITK
jgi:ATP-dependent DNA helicase DinG